MSEIKKFDAIIIGSGQAGLEDLGLIFNEIQLL